MTPDSLSLALWAWLDFLSMKVQTLGGAWWLIIATALSSRDRLLPPLPGCVLSVGLFDFLQAQLPDMSTVMTVDGMALWTEPVCMECRWCCHHG